MVGNGLHSISGWFKVGLRWLGNAYSSDSIHIAKVVGQRIKGSLPGCKGIGSHDTRGSVPGMQGDGFASKTGRIMEVAVCLCLLLLLGL